MNKILAASSLALALATTLVAQTSTEGANRGTPRLTLQVGGSVWGATYSPDGALVLTGGGGSAILWSASSGRELWRFQHASRIQDLAFSPDGERAIVATSSDGAYVWNVRTGERVGHIGRANPDTPEYQDGAGFDAVAFSHDGSRTLVGGSFSRPGQGQELTVRRQYIANGGSQDAPEQRDRAIAVSGDGSLVVTASDTVRIWEFGGQKRWRQLDGHRAPQQGWSPSVIAVAISPDNALVLSGSAVDHTAKLWDVASGRELLSLPHDGRVSGVAFAPTGDVFATVSWSDGERSGVLLWNRSGELLRKLGSERWNSVTFSPDGKTVLAGGGREAQAWEVATGRATTAYEGEIRGSVSVHPSPDMRRLLAPGGGVLDWEVQSGRLRRTAGIDGYANLAGPAGGIWARGSNSQKVEIHDLATGALVRTLGTWGSVGLSPDGARAVTLGDEGGERAALRLWDVASGRVLREFGELDYPRSAGRPTLSPDGSLVACGGFVYSASTGETLHELPIRESFAFTPDGTRLLSEVEQWEVSTGRIVGRFEQPGEEVARQKRSVRELVVSPDGSRALMHDFQTGSVQLFDVSSGRKLLQIEGASSPRFLPDGKRALCTSRDGTIRLWDLGTGASLAQLAVFKDDTWAVVDADGRFDASNGGAVRGLHWVVGDETIALSQLKERYYEPDLLAKLLGVNDQSVRNVAPLDLSGALFPRVEITHRPDDQDGVLRMRVHDRGGGIGRVAVRVNGKEVTADARAGAEPNGPVMDLSIDLSGNPLMVAGRDNAIEVIATNREEYLASRGVKVVASVEGTTSDAPPTLWAVVVGVSDYRGSAIDLNYASKDATDFATAIGVAGRRLLGSERVKITRLDDAGTPATRAALIDAFEALKGASPADILVVYLAGHGVTFSELGKESDYYYLLADASNTELRDPLVREQAAISSRELTELIKLVPAQKQVLVLDTCHSGQLIDDMAAGRSVSSDQTIALERLKDRTGMFIIAGSAADAVSYEGSRYGQGVLTYSLLEGIRGASLRNGTFVDVGLLLNYSTDRVPVLAKGMGGIQSPRLAVPRGGASFDIGQVTAPDRAEIPLAAAKPVILRSNFILRTQPRDSIALTPRVDEAIRARAAGDAKAAPFVFVDAAAMPDAFHASGFYDVDGERVNVSVFLYEGDVETAAHQFEVEGSVGALDALASDIVRTIAEGFAR